jgi:hypothetical protein
MLGASVCSPCPLMLAKDDAEKTGMHEVRPCRRADAEGIRRRDEMRCDGSRPYARHGVFAWPGFQLQVMGVALAR